MNRAIPEERRIEDIDSWLRTNGLRADASAIPSLDRDEERTRLQQDEDYVDRVHRKIFQADDELEVKRLEERAKVIQSWQGQTILIQTSSGEEVEASLPVLADSCHTIFALASSWNSFHEEDEKHVKVSLENFSKALVLDFIALALMSSSSKLESRVESLSDESIVACFEMAHYLQNDPILDATVKVLTESVDVSNCWSLCLLADHYHQQTLFERSLGIMMQVMGGEVSEAWDDLTPELRERITTMKAAIQSSVNSQQNRLYFGSLQEYISIFAERVQYFKERLSEAKEQLSLMERGSQSWDYTLEKVQRQELRVCTLERALAEQKRVFLGKKVRHS